MLRRALIVAGAKIVVGVMLIGLALLLALDALTSRTTPEWLGRTAAEWASRLDDPVPAVRDSAMAALGDLAPFSVATIRSAAARLLDSDGDVRRQAVRVLVHAGREDSAALVVVTRATMEMLRAGDRFGRVESARVLRALGRRVPNSVPSLLMSLRDPAPDVRDASATALGSVVEGRPEFGPPSESALVLEGLAAAVRDTVAVVREAALEAFARIAPTDPRLVVLVRRALEDPSPLVRDRARSIFVPAPALGSAIRAAQPTTCMPAAAIHCKTEAPRPRPELR